MCCEWVSASLLTVVWMPPKTRSVTELSENYALSSGLGGLDMDEFSVSSPPSGSPGSSSFCSGYNDQRAVAVDAEECHEFYDLL